MGVFCDPKGVLRFCHHTSKEVSNSTLRPLHTALEPHSFPNHLETRHKSWQELEFVSLGRSFSASEWRGLSYRDP